MGHGARPSFVFAALGLLIAWQLADATAPATLPNASASPKYEIEVIGQPNIAAFPEITVQFRFVDPQSREPVKGLPSGDLVVLEDEKEVFRQRRVFDRDPMAAVLAIDTSGSMLAQNKMDQAKRAAGMFFDKLDDRTPCGLVLFNDQTWKRQPLTLDKVPLRKLVAEAPAKGGTAYLDATSHAIDLLLSSEHQGQRGVVLMTDGRDGSSKADLDSVIAKAKAAKAPVYTIGLGLPGLNEPVRTVLVLDRSGSMKGKKIDALRKAASRFVALIPAKNADTTLIAFDNEVPPADQFTNKRTELLSQVLALQPRGKTALYDAAYDGLETLNAGGASMKLKTRKALVVLTDGMDTASRRRDTDVIELAKKDGVKIYLLGLGQGYELNEPVMQRMAGETGGKYFPVRNPDDLVDIFEDLSASLHDDGIDEDSLRRLAAETGGQYYHVRDAEKLGTLFERVAVELGSSHAVTFKSGRQRHDGTTRGLVLRFGDIAVGKTGYVTHGLITPMANPLLYLGVLAVLGVLLALPGMMRRRTRG